MDDVYVAVGLLHPSIKRSRKKPKQPVLNLEGIVDKASAGATKFYLLPGGNYFFCLQKNRVI